MESQEDTGIRDGNASSPTEGANQMPAPTPASTTEADKVSRKTKEGKRAAKSQKKHRKHGSEKHKQVTSTADSSSEDDEQGSSDSCDSSSSDTEEEAHRRRVLKKRRNAQKKSKKKNTAAKGLRAKVTRATSDSESNDSDAETGDESESEAKDRSKPSPLQILERQVLQLSSTVLSLQATRQPTGGSPLPRQGVPAGGYLPPGGGYLPPGGGYPAGSGYNPPGGFNWPHPADQRRSRARKGVSDENFSSEEGDGKPKARGHKGGTRPKRLEFKRVDQVWDSRIHNYKLQDTTEAADDSKYEEYLFHVRRTFDWEGKYKATVVDIRSKHLREALGDVMGNIKGVSLVEEVPRVDPNMLFLYLEDLREHMVNLKGLEPVGKSNKERKKVQKWIDDKRRHLKILVKYLDKDYAQTKKSLYPLLENGLITFDLFWALWKPGSLCYATTYGSTDEPRAFKVESAEKHYSIMKGDFYYIEGKYFEYDGKQFGYGSMSDEISDFRGVRKITSLNCYPLKFHKNETQLRKDLIERGKKFVSLSGVQYKSHQGMAYYKKKKSIVKVNSNGRVMIDPSIHRRINPNYPVSVVRPKDHDLLSDEDDSDEDGDGCDCESEEDGGQDAGLRDDSEERVKFLAKFVRDKDGNPISVRRPQAAGDDAAKGKLDKVPSKAEESQEKAELNGEDVKAAEDGNPNAEDKPVPEFPDEEYLIASPIVLGFAFAEKLWLEFTVSGVKEISWNEQAYESLVLEPKTKGIVKALVESHKYHAAESIDDVIQGKGKGLVAVLHGPPGTGKTLTAEGISELLKCPLYMVSAGDLGTDSRYLESELQKILDICHAWGAILLLDEADVFLEKRNMHDIHRNALVSIFLRQLEYFQGILFLTTNRVETFDDAFQSRIHIALRYDDLDAKAKKTIFKIFIERVRVLEKVDLMPFTEDDYNDLARNTLNGRQIKNVIRTAQALAVNKGEPLSMRHIREVLDVLLRFDRDLKGGPGFEDALRGYM